MRREWGGSGEEVGIGEEVKVKRTKEPNSLQLDQNWFGCVLLPNLQTHQKE